MAEQLSPEHLCRPCQHSEDEDLHNLFSVLPIQPSANMEPGLLIAYLALGVMAVTPIYYGSIAGLKVPKKVHLHLGCSALSKDAF